MRYGIISDVHGNLEALQAAIDHLRLQGAERWAFLGDAVGYGADPDAVCTTLRALGGVAILGNHDAAVAGRMDTSGYYEAAQEALSWCRGQLSPDNLAWLRALPYTAREGDVAFCHGSPADPEAFEYLCSEQQASDLQASETVLAPVTLIGHSHLPIAFHLGPRGVRKMASSTVECEGPGAYIITAGSVGQPRDRDPRACCGIFDTDSHTFTYHRLHYDRHTTRQKILDAGLAPVFGERLLVGI
jgi:diadenosine tetraphosphatase ApaH/serine/threonine PP2A family protein phosphatase